MIKKEIEKIVDQQLSFEERMRQLEKQISKINLDDMRKESHFMANIGDSEVKDRTDSLLSEAYHRLHPEGKFRQNIEENQSEGVEENNSSMSISDSQASGEGSTFSKIVSNRPSICEMLRAQESNILDSDSPAQNRVNLLELLETNKCFEKYRREVYKDPETKK